MGYNGRTKQIRESSSAHIQLFKTLFWDQVSKLNQVLSGLTGDYVYAGLMNHWPLKFNYI